MARYDERRGYKRHDLRAPVIFAYQDSDQFTKVQMYNYCEDGLCFEARNAIEPGSDTVSYTHLTLPTNVQQCRSRWSRYH